MLRGDTGTFLRGVFDQVQEGLGALLTTEQLLGGASPDFLANLTASQAGAPGGGTEALDLVQQYLRGGFV